MGIRCPRVSICLSQVGVLLKRLNAGSWKQRHTIALVARVSQRQLILVNFRGPNHVYGSAKTRVVKFCTQVVTGVTDNLA